MNKKSNSLVDRFALNPTIKKRRSKFSRSHEYKTTFDADYLYPFFVDEALPGDTFIIDMASLVRMTTPIYPIMDNLYMDVFFFAVPNRLVWDHWQNMMGERKNPDDSIDYLVPSLTAPDDGFETGSIYDYFGLPTKIGGIEVNSLFPRAYNLIYNEWFRDENLIDSVDVPTDDGPDDPDTFVLLKRAKTHDYFTSALPWPQKGDSVSISMGGTAPLIGVSDDQTTAGWISATDDRVALYKGIVTAAGDLTSFTYDGTTFTPQSSYFSNQLWPGLTDAQKTVLAGSLAESWLPSSSSTNNQMAAQHALSQMFSNVYTTDPYFLTVPGYGYDDSGSSTDLTNPVWRTSTFSDDYRYDRPISLGTSASNPTRIGITGKYGLGLNLSSLTDPNVGLVADLSQAESVTIDSLREAFAVQQLLEIDARGGTRYTEILRSHFGVVSPDARLQRPEYLGGFSKAFNVTPIAQTSSTDDVSPQGNLSAFGQITTSGHIATKSFVEHSLIIGLVNVRSALTYQQGINKMWTRQDRYSYYWPVFAHLGEQTVLNKEIYAQGNADDDKVFGYQERYSEYRYYPSLITGLMRSNASGTLDSWHLSQNFDSLPTLSKDFIESDVPMDRVLAVTDEPAFFGDFYFKVQAIRPMPVYSVPGLRRM